MAVRLGMKLELSSGRSFACLMCSADQNGEGILVEGVRGPSDEEADMVRCPKCEESHYVVSLADAIAEHLLEIDEAVPNIQVSEIVARMLKDQDALAKMTKAANPRSA